MQSSRCAARPTEGLRQRTIFWLGCRSANSTIYPLAIVERVTKYQRNKYTIMLVYKAAQVIASLPFVSKPYEFKDDKGEMRRGVSNFCDVTCLSVDGSVAVIRFKGKDEGEVKAKVAKLTLGKPCDISPIKGMEDSARGVQILNA